MSQPFYHHLMDLNNKTTKFFSPTPPSPDLSFPIYPLTLYSFQSSTTHDQHANPHLCDGHCAGFMTPPQGSQPSTQMVAHSAYDNHYASTHHRTNIAPMDPAKTAGKLRRTHSTRRKTGKMDPAKTTGNMDPAKNTSERCLTTSKLHRTHSNQTTGKMDPAKHASERY